MQPKDHQHGFRPKHCTITALHAINDQIATGFNQRKPASRTVLVALDLSKAFDTVDIDTLLEILLNSTLPRGIVRWFACYLRGRQSRVMFRGELSKARNIKTGVPQGAVLSPSLFNAYIGALPNPPDNISVVSYADDVTILATGPAVQPLCDNLNAYLPEVENFFKERSLIVSTVTLFTPHSAQADHHPAVYINGTQLPLNKSPKILGVIHDTMYTFSQHCKYAADRARQRNNLKAMAGATWGQDKETQLLTYRAIGKPVLEYGAQVWSPTISETSRNRLEVVERAALRTATGCHLMTSIDHLHQETRILPVRKHTAMISQQFLAACMQADHPGHRLFDRVAPPRDMKGNIIDAYPDELREQANPPLTAGECRKLQNVIHTRAVQEAIDSYGVNPVLGRKPPDTDLNIGERNLSRIERTRLAQLRSGYCKLLKSYQHRLDDTVPDECPKCHDSPHDTIHLFNCRADPTTLTPVDLWERPAEVAQFLHLQDQD